MNHLKKNLLTLAVATALLAVGFLHATIAQAGVLTDYAENKAVDWLIRGQTYTPPATQYWRLDTTTCSDAGPGTEVSGGSYARVAVTASMANWSGTQGAGTTVASTGTSATVLNNVAMTWPASTAAWGTLQSVVLMDASTAGNRIICTDLTAPLNVSGAGFTVSFPISSYSFQIDN